MLVIVDALHGCVRFLGDLKLAVAKGIVGGSSSGGGGGEPRSKGVSVAETAPAVVRHGMAPCLSRFGLHNVIEAEPPKHARCVNGGVSVWLRRHRVIDSAGTGWTGRGRIVGFHGTANRHEACHLAPPCMALDCPSPLPPDCGCCFLSPTTTLS